MLLQAKVGGGLLGGSDVVSKSIFYVNRYIQTTNATTYTFTACDIGTASADRRVIIGAHMYGGTSRSLAGTPTIAGINATVLTTNTASTGNSILLIAAVPTGTTGDIVLQWSSGCAGCAVSVWYATGLTSDTPIATASNISASAPTSGSLSTVDGGFLVAAATCRYHDGTLRTHSWTNATEQFDAEIENTGTDGGSISGAHVATTGASITVTDTFSTTAGAGRGAFATF